MSEKAFESGDEVTLRPQVDTLWRYRRVIGFGLLAATAGYLVILLALLVALPSERIGAVEFRLLFEGATHNQYPNGAPFSSSELVATPVLSQVFSTNDLQRYCPYDRFKESVYVLQSNPALDMLAYDYEARLSDTRLTPIDRARIEEEYKKKRDALVDPVFSLNLRRTERLTAMPTDLMGKVLGDILAVWAQQAAERKGALRYDIPMLTKNLFKDGSLERVDYLVAVDILRSKIQRVLATIDGLSQVPGAQVARTPDDEAASLAEIRARLENVYRFRLEPLLGIIRSQGITKDARELRQYAENQLFQLKQRSLEAEGRVKALQESLRGYSNAGGADTGGRRGETASSGAGPAVMPQLDQSFLDRLLDLSTASQEQQYRQKLTDQIISESDTLVEAQRETAYYQDLVSSLKAMDRGRSGSAEEAALVVTRFGEAYDEAVKATDQLNALYHVLSEQNLNPSTSLYAITSPFEVKTRRSISPRSVVMGYALVMLLAGIFLPAGCLVHNAIRTRKRVSS